MFITNILRMGWMTGLDPIFQRFSFKTKT